MKKLNSQFSEAISFRVTRSTRKKIELMSLKRNKTKSEFLRDFVNQQL